MILPGHLDARIPLVDAPRLTRSPNSLDWMAQSLSYVIGPFCRAHRIWKAWTMCIGYLLLLTITMAGVNKFFLASVLVFADIFAANPASTCPCGCARAAQGPALCQPSEFWWPCMR